MQRMRAPWDASKGYVRVSAYSGNMFSVTNTGHLLRIEIKGWSDRRDEVLLSREEMEIIERGVNELPEPYRTVFHLRDIETFTNQEMAGPAIH